MFVTNATYLLYLKFSSVGGPIMHKKMFKGYLALLLAIALILSGSPLGAVDALAESTIDGDCVYTFDAPGSADSAGAGFETMCKILKAENGKFAPAAGAQGGAAIVPAEEPAQAPAENYTIKLYALENAFTFADLGLSAEAGSQIALKNVSLVFRDAGGSQTGSETLGDSVQELGDGAAVQLSALFGRGVFAAENTASIELTYSVYKNGVLDRPSLLRLENITAAVAPSGVNEAPVASDVQITGMPKVGDTLTGSYTYSDAEGDAEGATSFSWRRADDASGTGETVIEGATEKTYMLREEDAGKYISFEATPRAVTGTETGEAAKSGPVGAVESFSAMAAMSSMDFSLMGTAAAPAEGDGSSSNPYIINEPSDLVWMSENFSSANSKYFLQTADIDMSGVPNFMPIGNGTESDLGSQFTGQYDGQCFEIQNLTINSGLAHVALFQYLGGTVKNVTLTNPNITCTNSVYSYSEAAGIAGYAANCTISNCGVSGGSISLTGVGTYSYTAGIAGSLWGTVQDCYVTAALSNVNSQASMGGIAAYTGSGSVNISNCYFAGSLGGASATKGGIVGNCYLGTILDNFFLSGTATYGLATKNSNTEAEPVSDPAMKSAATYTSAGWNFTNIWKIAEGTDYPRFITTPGQPQNLTATIGDGQIELDWDPAVKASAYKVYYGTTSGVYSDSKTVSVPAASTTLTGLTNGTKYFITVKALHNTEEGAASAEVNGVPHFTVTDLAATPDSGKVDFTFSAPAGADAVELQQSTDGGANYSAVAGLSLTSASTNASLTGLTNGTAYTFRLRLLYGGIDYFSNVVTVNAGNPDNTLSLLSATCALNDSFSPSVLSYTSSVGSAVSSISVTATLNSPLASLKINNTAQASGAAKSIDLVYGTNMIPVAVTAENGMVKTYTITVTRALPAGAVTREADASCDSYGNGDVIYAGIYSDTLEDAALKFDLSSYSGTLVSASLKIYVTTADSIGNGVFDLYGSDDNNWTTALPATKDGSPLYNDVTGLTMDDWTTFDVFSYVNSHLSADLSKIVTFYFAGQGTSGSDDYGFYSASSVTNKPCLVLVYQSNDARLSNIKVGGTALSGFSPDIYSYNYQAPVGTDLSTLSFTSTVNDSSATQGSWTYNAGSKQWTVTVTAEDGSEKTYTVNVSVANAAPAASNVQVAGAYAYNQALTGSYTYSDYEGNPQGASTFKWYRSDDAAGTGKEAVTGATSLTYTVQIADLGKYLSFEVTPVAAAGTITGTAKESNPVLVPLPAVEITFDAQGGSVTPASQTKLFDSTYGKASDGSTAAALPTPGRAGYTFAGWWTGAGGAGTQVTDTTTVLNPLAHTLYAKWTGNTYTITFDAQGGSVSPGTQSKLFGSTYGKSSDGITDAALPVPGRTGYAFAGWWTGAGGTGSLVTDSTTVSTASNHILYAKWTGNTYTVTFDAEGGSVSPLTQTKRYGSTYGKASDGTTEALLPVPIRTGYGFGGWWTGAGGTGTQVTDAATVAVASNHTLYAKWTGNIYTVSFDAQGGSVSTPTQNKMFGAAYGKASDGTTEALLPAPIRTGYGFGGWWTGAGGTGSLVTDSTTVSTASNHILYAKWTANTYTVTFDAEGGSVSPGTQTKLFDSTYGRASNGTADEALPTPTKSGFNFGGWWTGNNGTGIQITNGSTVATASDHTLYARWLGEVYTVTFNAEGGSVTPATQNKMFGATYGNGSDGTSAVNLPIPTKSGYSFGGWWTGTGGTGTQVTNSSTVATAANHTLYAKWTANTYTVNFDAQGGNVSPSSQSKLFGSTYGKASDGSAGEPLPVPARSGYSFGGWWTETGGTGTQVTDATAVSITAEQTLYAKWNANTYTVTFDAGSGSVSVATQVKLFGSIYGKASDGVTAASLPVAARANYIFGGWWTGAGGTGTQVTDATTVATPSDHTLYAKWNYTYTISPIGDKTMTELTAGYDAGTQETKTVTITRTGTGILNNLSVSLSGADADRFTVTQPLVTTLSGTAPSTTFTVKAKNGLPIGVFEARVDISADNMTAASFKVSQTVKPLQIKNQTVTFIVYDGESAVSGAGVTINGLSVQTGNDGKAVFTLPSGKYAYSTAKTGYSDTQGVFEVTGSEKTICLVLNKIGEVVLPDSDGNTDAVLIVDSGNVAQDVILMVDPLPAQAEDTNAIRVVSSSGEIAAVYDVYLLQQNARVQPNGTVRVGIPVPEGMEGKTLKVVRINDDGTVVEFEAAVVGNLLFFTTDHFSKYAIVAETAATGGGDTAVADTTANSAGSPKTGDGFALILILTICIASAAAVIILLALMKRASRNQMKNK